MVLAAEAMASHACGLRRSTGMLTPSEGSCHGAAAASASPRLLCRAMRTPRRAPQRSSPPRLPQRATERRLVPGHPRVFRRTAVDDQSSSTSSSTMTRDSAGNASEEASKDSTSGGEATEAKATDCTKPVTKDVLALRSLDAYFEKLDEPKKRGESVHSLLLYRHNYTSDRGAVSKNIATCCQCHMRARLPAHVAAVSKNSGCCAYARKEHMGRKKCMAGVVALLNEWVLIEDGLGRDEGMG